MGQLVHLDEYRERRRRASCLGRLEVAVARLERLIGSRGARLGTTVERELAAITLAVSAGRTEQAAEKAERLLGMLEHPLASG